MSNKIFSKEEVLELIKEFPEQPLFNKIIVTLNVESNEGLQLSETSLSDVQFVVAKGPNTSVIELGDKVRVDLDKLLVRVPVEQNSHEFITQIKVDPIFYNDAMFALVDDRLIKTIIKE